MVRWAAIPLDLVVSYFLSTGSSDLAGELRSEALCWRGAAGYQFRLAGISNLLIL